MASHFRIQLLSFFVVMRQNLHLPANLDGRIWQYDTLASANRRHTHAELELNLVTVGHGMYLLGNRRYEIRRGDLLWLFPSQEHVLIEQTSDFRMWVGVFRRRIITRVATDESAQVLLQKHIDRDPCRRLTRRGMQHLDRLFGHLSAASNPPLVNSGLAYALLSSWECFQNAGTVPVHDVHPAVERASNLIRNGSPSSSLVDLSRDAGLSPGRLSRLFHEQTGFTLVDFRNRQRLERFLELYGDGQSRTMLDAALEAGFGSYPQFHRIFHRMLGCSPRAYRQKAMNQDYPTA